jgi:hypothetical protein
MQSTYEALKAAGVGEIGMEADVNMNAAKEFV